MLAVLSLGVFQKQSLVLLAARAVQDKALLALLAVRRVQVVPYRLPWILESAIFTVCFCGEYGMR